MRVRTEVTAAIFDTNWQARAGALASVSILAIILTIATNTRAQTYTVLHTFTGHLDGGQPAVGLTMDRAGNIYGTTGGGGAGGYGTVFKMSPSVSGWEFSTLYTFHGGADGGNPQSRVVVGPDGKLYGATNTGGSVQCGYINGCGVVYSLQPPPTACKTAPCYWTEKVLYTFPFGAFPFGDLALDQHGNLYGLGGYLYELSPSDGTWVFTIINNSLGSYNGLDLDAAGNLYGEEVNLIYRLVPSGGQWIEQDLYTTNEQIQGYGISGVAFDQAGDIYAGASDGGPNGGGTVFELTDSNGSWSFNLLHAFSNANGYGGPYGGNLLLDPAGNVYGTNLFNGNHNVGSVFKLARSGDAWSYTDLHDFQGGSDGCYPLNSMVRDAVGNIYGVTRYCGSGNQGNGVLFAITP